MIVSNLRYIIGTGWSDGKARNSYSGGTRFELQSGYWLSDLRFHTVFLSPSMRMLG
jgi:hypothetical protein